MTRPGPGLRLAAGLIGLAALAATAEAQMIDPDAARAIAGSALVSGPAADDPAFAAWDGLGPGDPRLVHDLAGAPAYWAVPLVAGSRAVGFVRVMPDGTLAAVGLTCRTPGTPAACPETPIALDPDTVAELTRTAVRLAPGEALGPPRLVHDGPPGREVWLSEIRQGDRPVRWIFTGSGGVYERAAGTLPRGGADLE